MPFGWQTLKEWIGEARRAGAFAVATGNHHLFLLARTASGEDWIILLGKRQKHFPFFGCRFDNATLYNRTGGVLFHTAKSILPKMEWALGAEWRVGASEPLPFCLHLQPQKLCGRRIFLKKIPLDFLPLPGARFRYHRLALGEKASFIGDSPVTSLHGVSEVGHLEILTPADWRVPFDYRLTLGEGGTGGKIEWSVPPFPAVNFLQKGVNRFKKSFLKDAFAWGEGMGEMPEETTLAVTEIPLGNFILRRAIIVSGNGVGLSETFRRPE